MSNKKPKTNNTFSKMSKEERVEYGRQGGIASGEAKRKRKAMKEQMDLLMSMPVQDKALRTRLRVLNIDDEEATNQMASIIALWHKSLKGDTKAFELLRDTLGEKPKEADSGLEVLDRLDLLLKRQSSNEEE